MLFNSLAFLVFVLVILVLLSFWQRLKLSPIPLLLIASYVFYGWWNAWYLFLIVGSTLLDYTISILISRIQSKNSRRLLCFFSIATNLSLLIFFKYSVWLTEFISRDLNSWLVEHIILPVGISFYTFQTMSYTIDVYRKEIEPERNILKFALYVTYFPQLIAGPIERAINFLPQVSTVSKIHLRQSSYWLILTGYFRKIVLADNLAIYVDESWAYDSLNIFSTLLGILAFSFQIYFDFSGYSRIARGISGLFGIDLSLNFNYPYSARSFRDFWARWHITLSTWFRDYIYIPLGGSRSGNTKRNILLVFIISGIWHGANVTFVLWGLLHGLMLLLERRIKINYFTFLIILFLSWVPFRAPDLSAMSVYLSGLFSFNLDYYSTTISLGPLRVLFTILIIGLSPIYLRIERRENRYLFLILPILIFYFSAINETFIYFQF